jgi:hypothetical protein
MVESQMIIKNKFVMQVEQAGPTIVEAYDHYKRFQMDLEFVQMLANPRFL